MDAHRVQEAGVEMDAISRRAESRGGTKRGTWGSNAPRIIGWASCFVHCGCGQSGGVDKSSHAVSRNCFAVGQCNGSSKYNGSSKCEQTGVSSTPVFDDLVVPEAGCPQVSDAQQAQQTPDGCTIPYIPRSIQLEEDFWSFLHRVRITSEESKHQNLGYVQSHPFSMTNEQSWYDANGRQVATSHRDVVSLVATIYVGDCRGESLAVVDEQLVASPSSSVTLITVKDESGAELARSEASTQFENQLHVTDMVSGKQVATIRQRPGSTDFWDIDLPSGAEEQLAADPRLIVMAVAAESASVAFGFGALPFLLLLVTFVIVVAALCFNMARHSDANDPRYGLFAMFDGADRSAYAEISERDRVVHV